MSKIHDVNRHFVNNDADILGLVETFLKSNDRLVKLSKHLSWVVSVARQIHVRVVLECI